MASVYDRWAEHDQPHGVNTIERLILAQIAAARTPAVLLAVHPRTPAAPPSRFTGIVLWHEPPTVDGKYTRDDAWRVLLPGAAPADVGTGLIFAADAEMLTEVIGVPDPLAPIDLGGSFSSLAPAALLEAVCLLALHRLPVAFSYRKVGASVFEPRSGRALGTKNGLLFVEDASREGATRSFRLDQVTGLHVPAGVPRPRWDGRGYAMPEISDGGADPCPF